MIVLAHPLTQVGELPVSPLVLAIIAVAVVVAANELGRWALRNRAPVGEQVVVVPGPKPLRPTLFWVVRGVGLLTFGLAIATALMGHPSQLSNLAPALVVGAGWPLLVLASLAVGYVWWWLNPFDTLARPLAALGAGDATDTTDDEHWPPVWWALVPAAAWMGYVMVWPTALLPRSIATVLLGYTFLTLAGCLGLGRRTWLWRGEFFTVFLGCIAGVRRHGPRAALPRASAAVSGVVSGAALFGLVRDSDMGIAVAYGPYAQRNSYVVVAVAMVVGAVLFEWLAREPRRRGASVGLTLVAAAAALAVGLARNRFTTSLQLLPIFASDPFGAGRDLFGTRLDTIVPAPFGVLGLVVVQAVVLTAGGVAAALLATRSAALDAPARRVPTPGLLGICAVVGVGVAAAAAI